MHVPFGLAAEVAARMISRDPGVDVSQRIPTIITATSILCRPSQWLEMEMEYRSALPVVP